jgi:hypothetical protein
MAAIPVLFFMAEPARPLNIPDSSNINEVAPSKPREQLAFFSKLSFCRHCSCHRWRICFIWFSSLAFCLSDGGFGGWGRERPVKQRATGVSLWRGLDHHSFRVQTVSTKHCNRPKGKNDGRIASLSHRTKGEYKNLPLPLPPTTERTGGYIEERVFGNFQNFREPRFKMSKPGFWVFSRWVRE